LRIAKTDHVEGDIDAAGPLNHSSGVAINRLLIERIDLRHPINSTNVRIYYMLFTS
jgi:hypothetical protein